MDPFIPLLLHPLLEDFARRLQQELPGRIEAFYLEGSIALGAFSPRFSDIDFVAVLDSQASSEDFDRISRIHAIIARQYPAWKMQGMYFQWSELGCEGKPFQPFPSYHDGKLHWSDRFELSTVTWWILKNHGIAVFGPDPRSLDLTIDMDRMLEMQQENLHTYWASWTKRPVRILALLSDWGIEWTILGVLRQFYTLREHKITSKTGAGEYALACLPSRWHAIIREAIARRQNSRQFYYRSRVKRAINAFRFLKYVMGISREPERTPQRPSH